MSTGNETKKTGYQPADWEEKLYQLWLDSGFFNPETAMAKGKTRKEAEPFSMVLPPPNATGTLHTGSACMLAIEDVFVRFARMQGRPTLWLPGTDHAAIATQSKVERLLSEQEGKTRHDLGREKLVTKISEFVETNQGIMINQMKKMGASLDWSRLAFTMDDQRNLSVRTAFKKMYDEGIIYRGDRIVNWDPKGQTTISDDEIVYEERTGEFYYFQYGPFIIGTARPETKFGDKYVVIHPEDKRYQEYAHGQKIEVEWINGPITATVIKDTAIDPEFGTGVMTITPWHSVVDFEIAERHNLEWEQIIDTEGKLLPIAEELAGFSIAEARAKVVEKLKAKGLLVKTEDGYIHQVATAERTGATVEPQIMRQWFIGVNKEFTRDGKMVTLKKLMQEAVRSEEIHIIPGRFQKIYFHWIDNLRDWCISRQLWYGHQIPVWYKGEEIYCGMKEPEGNGWTQDPDTLDTWFSSGMWTFSTLGWGSDDKQWQQEKIYHPTTILETGYDLIFFWVARMILMSTYLLGEVPFKKVYLHGLVRDEQGQKMSKSLDNIVDPLDVISEYGTDALRLALMSGTTPGNDLRLGDEKFTSSRNFVNKLWNISRYVDLQEQTSEEIILATPADHFIAYHFEVTRDAVTKHLEDYNLSLAIEELRDFTLSHFADWYVEIHKYEKNTSLLRTIFQELITLWHPFIPFVTEAIQQEIFSREELLLIRPWPQIHIFPAIDTKRVTLFETAQSFVSDIRLIRGEYKINLSTSLHLELPQLTHQEEFQSLFTLAKVTLEKGTGVAIPVGMDTFSGQLFLGDSIDIQKERARLQKEIVQAKKYLLAMQAKLTNEGFLSKAGPLLKESTKKLIIATEERITALMKALKQLN